MTKNRLVAFTGKKYHGKDTAAQSLRSQGYKMVSLAQPVRMVCHTMFGLQAEEMNDPLLKQKILERWPYQTPRKLMQEVAQFARDKYPGIWVIRWEQEVARQFLLHESVVTTDLRYLDEAVAVKKLGGIIIRIVRPFQEDDEFSSHPSETELSNIVQDFTIINDKTPEHLQEQVEGIVFPKQRYKKWYSF